MKVIVFILCLVPALVFADQRVIVLTDGSRIHGEVVGMNGDAWVIRTQSLGEIEVPSSRIRGMETPGSEPVIAPASGSLSAIESTITGDATLMARIMSLRSDPQVQAVLSDPEVMAAVRSLDFDALRKNPKFQALMNDPEMKATTSGLR